MKKIYFTLACAGLSLPASVVWGHEGHALMGTHWHPTDVWGFAGLGTLALLVFFVGRK